MVGKAPVPTKIARGFLACQQQLLLLGGVAISLSSLTSNVTSGLHGDRVMSLSAQLSAHPAVCSSDSLLHCLPKAC